MLKRLFILLISVAIFGFAKAQTVTDTFTLASTQAISTAVPFLTITPDARAGGMGDLGVATSPDVYSMHWNAAKYAFSSDKAGAAISYTPWLRNLASDISLLQLVGYFRNNDRQAFAASLTYFSVGDIQLTNANGEDITAIRPNEFAIDGAYALKLTDYLSGAITLRFIYSNITGGFSADGSTTDSKPGIAFAGDLGFYYNNTVSVGGNDLDVSGGIQLSNIGSKISYGSTYSNFIPANFRLGGGVGYKFNDYNKLTWNLDLNKLMVPTPPIRDNDGNVILGKEIPTSVPVAIIQSFYDAPLGFKEELAEFMISTGFEYSYKDMAFIRAGYFGENQYKGNRKYATAGLGFNFKSLNIDLSYIIPVSGNQALQGIMRVSLSATFGGKNKTVNKVE